MIIPGTDVVITNIEASPTKKNEDKDPVLIA